MAIFRKIHTSFWSDSFVGDLTPEQKYFYLFLLTNEHTKQCGIYEMTIRQVCFNTGYNEDTVNKLIQFFIDNKKIVHDRQTNEFVIVNWLKYNNSFSGLVQTCIRNELKLVKNKELIQYVNSMHTQSQEEQNKNRTEEEVETTTFSDEIFLKFKEFRPEIPDKILQQERYKFDIRYKNKTVKKDIKLIQTWATNINYVPRGTSDHDKILQKNRDKYGT